MPRLKTAHLFLLMSQAATYTDETKVCCAPFAPVLSAHLLQRIPVSAIRGGGEGRDPQSVANTIHVPVRLCRG